MRTLNFLLKAVTMTILHGKERRLQILKYYLLLIMYKIVYNIGTVYECMLVANCYHYYLYVFSSSYLS